MEKGLKWGRERTQNAQQIPPEDGLVPIDDVRSDVFCHFRICVCACSVEFGEDGVAALVDELEADAAHGGLGLVHGGVVATL